MEVFWAKSAEESALPPLVSQASGGLTTGMPDNRAGKIHFSGWLVECPLGGRQCC
jgi:hypothetical protein